MANKRWESRNSKRLLFSWTLKSLQMVTAAMKLKDMLLGRKAMANRNNILKSRHYFANKGPSSQSYDFSSSHVWMWELDHKEGRTQKNWCFWIVVLEKTWEDFARSNKSILREVNPEYSLEGLMLKMKLQYFGHLMWRANSLQKTLILGKIEGKRQRGHRGWYCWMASLTQ